MMGMMETRKGKRTLTSVSVGATAVQLVGPNVNRKTLMIQNQGTAKVYLGPSTVTATGATTGRMLDTGLTFVDDATDEEWWAVSGSGSNVLSVMEVS